jgi:hypothetical protein
MAQHSNCWGDGRPGLLRTTVASPCRLRVGLRAGEPTGLPRRDRRLGAEPVAARWMIVMAKAQSPLRRCSATIRRFGLASGRNARWPAPSDSDHPPGSSWQESAGRESGAATGPTGTAAVPAHSRFAAVPAQRAGAARPRHTGEQGRLVPSGWVVPGPAWAGPRRCSGTSGAWQQAGDPAHWACYGPLNTPKTTPSGLVGI